MPNEISIESVWQSFCDDHPEVKQSPGVVVALIRDAFFAGAHTSTWILNHYTQDEVSDADAGRLSKAMFGELSSWAQVYRARHGIEGGASAMHGELEVG